jgi:hypothetical protein
MDCSLTGRGGGGVNKKKKKKKGREGEGIGSSLGPPGCLASSDEDGRDPYTDGRASYTHS